MIIERIMVRFADIPAYSAAFALRPTARISKPSVVFFIKNQMTKDYLAREKSGADKMELERFTLGSLRRAVFDGDTRTGSLMAGQVAGMVHSIRPLRAIFEELQAQSEACLRALNQSR